MFYISIPLLFSKTWLKPKLILHVGNLSTLLSVYIHFYSFSWSVKFLPKYVKQDSRRREISHSPSVDPLAQAVLSQHPNSISVNGTLLSLAVCRHKENKLTDKNHSDYNATPTPLQEEGSFMKNYPYLAEFGRFHTFHDIQP